MFIRISHYSLQNALCLTSALSTPTSRGKPCTECDLQTVYVAIWESAALIEFKHDLSPHTIYNQPSFGQDGMGSTDPKLDIFVSYKSSVVHWLPSMFRTQNDSNMDQDKSKIQ